MPSTELLQKWSAVVIGGANIDLKCQTAGKAIAGTSNPGSCRMSPGGVGRNVAENLARLGVATTLVTAVGNDAGGAQLLADTASAGVDLQHALRTSRPTGSYTAILGLDGEMIIAVAAMQAMQELDAAAIDNLAPVIALADVVVVDCNVPERGLLRAAAIARNSGIPLVIDPVSVPKATHIRNVLDASIPIHTVTPNLAELRALTGRDDINDDELGDAARLLHDRGVSNVWVRLGVRGSFLSCFRAGVVTAEYAAPCPATAVDPTGAGDAMLAGYVAAMLAGMSEHESARYGRAAAAITVESHDTVSPAMSFALLASRASVCA